jgi:hypothetical protein
MVFLPEHFYRFLTSAGTSAFELTQGRNNPEGLRTRRHRITSPLKAAGCVGNSRVDLAHDESEHLLSAESTAAAVDTSTETTAGVTTPERSVGISATVAAAGIAASPRVVFSSAVVVAPMETATVAPSTASVESASPIALVPGPGSKEDSAREPVRSVVAVRSAGVRIETVIAVMADGRTNYVSIPRPKSYAKTNRNLAMGKGRGDYQNSY